jgi:hypothetical protein
MKEDNILLFDVGGTWTKVAIAKNNKIISKKILMTGNFALSDIKLVIENAKINFSQIIIACAGPVKDGTCRMTNATHVFDEKALTELLKIKVIVINDLESIAYGLKSKYKSGLIIEIGTGLGVSLISNNKSIIPSEEGHYLIDKELFMSVPEFREIIIPQYEYLLSGKNNVLIKIFNKSFISLNLQSNENNKNIYFRKDRFSEIYMKVLESFIDKLLIVHKNEKIKTIIFTGGVVSGNKIFMNKFILEMKKRFKKEKKGIEEIKIIDDEFLGIKGALAFYKEK